jgi:hypothetical protein
MTNYNRNGISRGAILICVTSHSTNMTEMSAFSDLMDPTPTPRIERLIYFDSEDVEPQIPLELQEYNFPIDCANSV